jgi:Abnormal spindle-like microcephaly-assoc'd, ASPM-SPD-2-Hydin
LLRLLHNLPRFRTPHGWATLCIIAVLFFSGCANYHAPSALAQPDITLSSTTFNFKTVVLGQTVTQSLHLSNSGTAPLSISGLSVSDKQFSIAGPSVPRVVLPKMGLDYTLSFTPSAAGAAAASLKIASNAVNTVAAVSLTGTGERVVAAANVSPSSLNFGTLTLQTTSTKNVTLQNSGDVSITISGITVVGAGFGFSNLSPGYSLAPSQAVTFQVWFKPTVKGPAAGTVNILSGNLSWPATMSLSGDGASSTPAPPPPPPPAVQHTVHLTWNPSSSSVSGYRVYRSLTAGGGFQPITGSLVNALLYDDDTVASGTTYFYAVTAVDSSGLESTDSSQVTAVIPTP